MSRKAGGRVAVDPHRSLSPRTSRIIPKASASLMTDAAEPVKVKTQSFTYARLNRPLTRTSPCEDWSLTSLKEKLIKIGAKVVSHGRYVAFQMAEVASRYLSVAISRLFRS
jgi:hypothetical protein